MSGSRLCLTRFGAPLALAAALSLLSVSRVLADDGAGAPQVHVVGNYPHGYIEFTANPGDKLGADITVADGGSIPATFLITAVDAYTSPASGVVYGTRQTPFRDGPSGNGEFGAGRWIRLDTSQVSLSPGQSVPVHAAIAVPAGTHPGDWVGGINAENPAVNQPSAGSGGGGGAQLRYTEATAIAIVVHVPGPTSIGSVFLGQPQIRVVGVEELLDIPLRYTGDLLTKPTFSFKITDGSGKTVYQHSGRFDTFMPHTTIVYSVALQSPLAKGDYTFTGTVGPDGNPQTATFKLRVGSTPPSPGSSGGEGSGGGIPIWALGLVAPLPILALAALLAAAVRRRCSHCRRIRPWGLMRVEDYREISSCNDCRARAREREVVRLCSDCYRDHVLPVARQEAALSHR